MRLISLEIKGFKSFADKQVVHFGDNVIGIVGPNGCGKSNIVDAIRWVLGEQKSKELRSDKMENVIFNGTKDRKAGGLAEVTLTFENNKGVLPTEYHIVAIKRVLYRDGESEYRINDVKCRLKDITNLLADTGMGSDSYAIIALGMVDDLLADKENARRRLFEQAAGVSRFKMRKKETLQKLDGTEQDLARVEDLLFEIENNLKSLEKQAKRAKRFFEMKDEYKTEAIQLSIAKVSVFKQEYKAIEVKMRELEDRKAMLEAQMATAEAGMQKDKSANLDKERILGERQRELNSLTGRIRGAENDKKMMAQKNLFVQESGDKLTQRITSNEQKVQQLLDDNERYVAQMTTEQQVLEQWQGQVNEAQAAMDEIRSNHSSLKVEVERSLKEQQTLESQIFESEKKRANATAQSENLRRELGSVDENIAKRKKEIEEVRPTLRLREDQQEEKEDLIASLQAEEEKRVKQVEKEEQLLEQCKGSLTKINRGLDAKRNEFKLIKNMVDSLEGFPESIRFLSKESNWRSKAPLLSDIIYVKEEVRTAIENYLEPYLNYYVVHNLEEAYQAIQLLEMAQKGKANFFLLDAFKEHVLDIPLVANAQNALGMIEIDKEYASLAQYLLGNVFLSDLPERELLSGNVPSDNLVYLSKKGSLMKRRFAVSGGSVGLFEGKRIGRRKQLELLESEIKELDDKAFELTRQSEETRVKLNSLRNNSKTPVIQQEKGALERILRDIIALRGQVENFQNYLSQAQSRKTEVAGLLEKAEADILQYQQNITELNEAVTSAKSRLSDADSSYREVADRLSAASSLYNQRNIEFIKQQNKLGGVERELGFVKRQLEDTQRQLQLDKDALAQSQSELQHVATDLKTLDEDLANMYEQRKVAERLLREAETEFYAARAALNALEDGTRGLTKAHQETFMALGQMQTDHTAVKLQMTSLNERLQVEFGVNINEIINMEPPEGFDMKAAESRVEQMRMRLANYGEINPMAVEAYDEMKERFDFITQQRADLWAAKESLLATITEIEQKATSQFMDAFDRVRTNFHEVFRSLFTEEDTCDLVLTDPEHPLESDINIIAKPKGKRPLTINQLSGGEKTLTATALLFSLYLLKPAPFCIFDEVDAPLDDANIAKFNKIIQKFSDNSQFIIVTHNKATMASVDVMYGVTMPTQGVSRVVPVDLRAFAVN